MNIIDLSQEAIEQFEYEYIKGFVKHLEEEPEKHRGSLVIRLPEQTWNDEAPFLNKGLRVWYMGLLNNVPNILYFLSDERERNEQWTQLQFAMLMLGDIRVKHDDKITMSYEVKYHEDMFKNLLDKTATYMEKLNGKTELTVEQKDFFAHILFDYTNGFYR